MNLQSKFGYCIITKTLIIGLVCKQDGITDRQTDKRTEGRSDYYTEQKKKGIILVM